MKTLFLSAAVIVAATRRVLARLGRFGHRSATALARDLLRSGRSRASADRNSFYHCNLALDRGSALSRDDRAATLVNRGVLYLRSRNYRSAEARFRRRARGRRATTPKPGSTWAIVNLQQGGAADALPMIERVAVAQHRRARRWLITAAPSPTSGCGNIRAAYTDLRRAQRTGARTGTSRPRS